MTLKPAFNIFSLKNFVFSATFWVNGEPSINISKTCQVEIARVKLADKE